MENRKNPNTEELKIEISEHTQKLDNKADDLFYESVKLLFDIGFDLADNLNLELIEDFFKKRNIKE